MYNSNLIAIYWNNHIVTGFWYLTPPTPAFVARGIALNFRRVNYGFKSHPAEQIMQMRNYSESVTSFPIFFCERMSIWAFLSHSQRAFISGLIFSELIVWMERFGFLNVSVSVFHTQIFFEVTSHSCMIDSRILYLPYEGAADAEIKIPWSLLWNPALTKIPCSVLSGSVYNF